MVRPILLLLVAGLLASGCARVTTNSDVNADGSWTRKLKLVVSEQGPTGLEGGEKAKVEDVFRPPAGPEWKIERTTEERDAVLTAVRQLKPGESITNDVVIKKDKTGVPALTNQVTVTMLEDGKIEYREKILWKGDRTNLMDAKAEAKLPNIRKALPAAVSNDANARKVLEIMGKEIWRTLFGPGDPMFSLVLTHQDLAEKRVKQRVAANLDPKLAELFGSAVSETDRRSFIQKLFTEVFNTKDVFDKDEKASEAEGNSGPMLVAMLFSVKLPGKIVSTNGEIDLSTGEVFWGLYMEAAAIEDLTLIAICDPKG